MEVLFRGYHILSHHLPPVSWEHKSVPIVCSGLSSSSCSSGGSFQDAVEGGPGMDESARPGLLQQPIPSSEGDKGWRPVINLSTLNGCVALTRFQMETVVSVLGSVRKGNLVLSVDLKDAYF